QRFLRRTEGVRDPGLLCARHTYSESRISTMLSSETGAPLRRYIIVRKIIYAQNLLREGCTVEQASSGAGFNDYCNFISTFKYVAGLSPRQWQRQLTTREE
ncbi:MAG: helix-turn-helix domain-containing protein, partial [Aristaeellaceae bacterium]